MSGSQVSRGELQVAAELDRLISEEVLPGTGVSAEGVWSGLEGALRDLVPTNRALLDTRERMQREIDAWHFERKGKPIDPAEYRAFLSVIGYLLPEPDDVTIATTNVDSEIARVAGPKLLVPVMNARFALICLLDNSIPRLMNS